jgi:hypothetical protein
VKQWSAGRPRPAQTRRLVAVLPCNVAPKPLFLKVDSAWRRVAKKKNKKSLHMLLVM